MPTEDAYSSGHLVLSHFGTCKCSNVETNISWTCLVSGLLSFEHPSVLLFLLRTCLRTSILLHISALSEHCIVNLHYWNLTLYACTLKVFPEGLMVDMASKIFQAVLCSTQLFLWKLICTFNQHSLSSKISNRRQFNSSLFPHKMFTMLLHWHTFFNMCHTLKTRLNT